MATTVRHIFDLAAAIVFEKFGVDSDFDQYSPLFIERMLQEALPYENMIRQQKGLPLVESVPELTAIDDTSLDWDDRITKNALVHGLASCLMGDDNNKKAEALIEYNKFVQALDEAAPAIMEGETANAEAD